MFDAAVLPVASFSQIGDLRDRVTDRVFVLFHQTNVLRGLKVLGYCKEVCYAPARHFRQYSISFHLSKVERFWTGP